MRSSPTPTPAGFRTRRCGSCARSAMWTSTSSSRARRYEECLSVRRRTDHPFVLDETIDGIGVLLRATGDLAMDVVNIKISKFGGLTRARQARDLCVSLGIAMTIEDSLGRRRDDGRDRAPGALARRRSCSSRQRISTATSPSRRLKVHRRGRTGAWRHRLPRAWGSPRARRCCGTRRSMCGDAHPIPASTPRPRSRARRHARWAATRSSTAMPSDLNTVTL